MSLAFRRSLVVVAVLASSWVVSGCAESPEATAGTAGTSGSSEPAFVEVKVTDSALELANKAGQPLLNMTVTVRPSRGSSEYKNEVRRFESTQKLTIPFSELKTGGGLPFRGNAKSITISATDFVGAKRDITITP